MVGAGGPAGKPGPPPAPGPAAPVCGVTRPAVSGPARGAREELLGALDVCRAIVSAVTHPGRWGLSSAPHFPPSPCPWL